MRLVSFETTVTLAAPKEGRLLPEEPGMAIPLKCRCGKRLQAPDDRAGTRVRCPACQELVLVPGQRAEDDEDGGGYDVAAFVKCPGCQHEWPAGTVVCIDCGWNFQKKRKMHTVYKVKDIVVEWGARFLGCYSQAVLHRERTGELTLTLRSWVLFLPVGRQEVDLDGYTRIVTDFTPGNDEAPDVYYVDLEGPHRRPVRVYCGSDERTMHEIIDTIKESTRMEITRR
jgi:hypothetical protein